MLLAQIAVTVKVLTGVSLAASLGVPDRVIMRQGGWKSVSSKKERIDTLKSP